MVKPYVARKFRHACGVSCINVSDLSLGSLPLPSWISARANSSHGETVGQSLISRAEQCNRLAFASRTSNCAVTPEDFLAAYANGLDEFGYDNSPLEKMAYDAEALFRRSSPIFDAEKFVAEQLGRLR